MPKQPLTTSSPRTLRDVSVAEAAGALAKRAAAVASTPPAVKAAAGWGEALRGYWNSMNPSAQGGLIGAGAGGLAGLGLGMFGNDEEGTGGHPLQSALGGALAGGAVGAGVGYGASHNWGMPKDDPLLKERQEYTQARDATAPGPVAAAARGAGSAIAPYLTNHRTAIPFGLSALYEGGRAWRGRLAKNLSRNYDPQALHGGLKTYADASQNRAMQDQAGHAANASPQTQQAMLHLFRDRQVPPEMLSAMHPSDRAWFEQQLQSMASDPQHTPSWGGLNANNVVRDVMEPGVKARMAEAVSRAGTGATARATLPPWRLSSYLPSAEHPSLSISARTPWQRRFSGGIRGAAPFVAATAWNMLGGNEANPAAEEARRVIEQRHPEWSAQYGGTPWR